MAKTLIDIRDEGLGHIFGTDLVTAQELVNVIKDLECELESEREHFKDTVREFEDMICCEGDPYDKKMDYMLENNLI